MGVLAARRPGSRGFPAAVATRLLANAFGIGLSIALFSVLFLWLYYLLIGLRLLRISAT